MSYLNLRQAAKDLFKMRDAMPMKAYACPRCLTLSSATEEGDGGAHTCTPTPLVRDLESRVAELEAQNAGLLQANRDCTDWFDALRHDHQIALKALDDLARLGNGKDYGNSVGNRIAQDAIASMID